MAPMVEAKSLRKALIPPSLLPDPSPGHLQSTRLALHLNDGTSSCSAFVASASRVYKIEVMCGRWRESEKALSFRGDSNWLGFSKISMEDSTASNGKKSLLIPVHAQVINSSVVDRCPHRSEIQSVVLAEGDGDNCFILGTVDSYGHLIISRLDTTAAGFHIQYCLGLRYRRRELDRSLLPDPFAKILMFMIETFTSATYARCDIRPLSVLFRVECIVMGILLY